MGNSGSPRRLRPRAALWPTKAPGSTSPTGSCRQATSSLCFLRPPAWSARSIPMASSPRAGCSISIRERWPGRWCSASAPRSPAASGGTLGSGLNVEVFLHRGVTGPELFVGSLEGPFGPGWQDFRLDVPAGPCGALPTPAWAKTRRSRVAGTGTEAQRDLLCVHRRPRSVQQRRDLRNRLDDPGAQGRAGPGLASSPARARLERRRRRRIGAGACAWGDGLRDGTSASAPSTSPPLAPSVTTAPRSRRRWTT